jgi:hypothetical protein
LIAHQNSKELKGVSQLTEKAIGNYITELFSYGFRERGPKERIVIEKGLEMDQNYRMTQIDEIDINNIEVKKVKARKFGKDFAENLVKKYKAEEKLRVEWFEGEELDQDDAVISERWHGAVNKLFKKNTADSNGGKSNPAGQKNKGTELVGAGGTGNSPKSSGSKSNPGSPKNVAVVTVNIPALVSPKSAAPNP